MYLSGAFLHISCLFRQNVKPGTLASMSLGFSQMTRASQESFLSTFEQVPAERAIPKISSNT